MAIKEKLKFPKYMITIPILIPFLIPILIPFFMNISFSLVYGEDFNLVNILSAIWNACWELIPYLFIVVRWKRVKAWENIDKKFGLIAAFVLLLPSQLYWETIFWSGVFSKPPNYPDIKFAVGSFLLTSPILGLIGYKIGLLIKRIKKPS